MHMHTHKPKQPKARHKDAPCDRMQPPGERKWLYPPKQCFYFSQTLLHGLGGAVLLYTKHSFKPSLHNLSVITHFCVLPRHWKWFLVTSLFPINKQTLATTLLSYLLSDTLKSKTHASAVSCPLLHRPEVTQVSFLTEIRLFPLFDALKRTSRARQFSLLFSHTIL